MSGEVEKRKLIDLRVVELRSELEKRGLDKNGVKSLLIERLEKSLKEEGHDPDVYLFQLSEKKSPAKRTSKRGEQDTESETQSNADENHDQDVDEDEREDELDKSNVQSEDGDGKEESVGKAVNAEIKVDQVKVKVEKPEPMETDSEKEPAVVTKEVAKVEKPEVVTDAEKKNDSASKEPEKAPAPVADGDKNIPEANGLDNEDSINLTIGEEDEKLLAEEEDSSHEKDAKGKENEGSLHKKDEAAAAQDKDDKQASAAEDKQVKTDEQAASEDKMGVDKNKSVSQVSGDPKAVKDDKDKKKVVGIPAGSSRNLWVSGLSSSTRATDIKQVFSKYGKVIGAKVVTNARTPGARCYGYVTMATSEEATKCIQHLHRTELHGRMISVERAKGDSTGPPKKSETKSPVAKKVEEKKRHERKLSTSKGDEKKEEGEKIPAITDQALKDETKQEVKPAVKLESKNEAVSEDKTAAVKEEEKMLAEKREASRERKERERRRSVGSSHHSRHQSTSPHRGPAHHVSPVRRPGVLTFAQIREARERQRLRERERELREEERRRREEFNRQREIERRNKEEAMRLEREKEKLRLERERIERDRAELLRLERERQKLEREKLEREREELKRQQMRLEEARRSTKRPADDRREPYPDERKRIATERRYEGSGRFEDRSESFENKKNTKMGTVFNHHATKIVNSNFDESRSSRRDRDGLVGRTADLPRRDHASPDSGGRKERFDRPSFRSREDHRGESDHRSKLEMRSRERYVDSGKGEGRYTDRSGDTWHSGGGPAPPKPFSSVPSPRPAWPIGDRDRKGDSGQSWGRPLESSGSDRWVSGGGGPMSVVSRGPGLSGPGMYPGPQGVSPSIPGMGLGLGPGPYSADRFDAYKQSLPIRKY